MVFFHVQKWNKNYLRPADYAAVFSAFLNYYCLIFFQHSTWCDSAKGRGEQGLVMWNPSNLLSRRQTPTPSSFPVILHVLPHRRHAARRRRSLLAQMPDGEPRQATDSWFRSALIRQETFWQFRHIVWIVTPNIPGFTIAVLVPPLMEHFFPGPAVSLADTMLSMELAHRSWSTTRGALPRIPTCFQCNAFLNQASQLKQWFYESSIILAMRSINRHWQKSCLKPLQDSLLGNVCTKLQYLF